MPVDLGLRSTPMGFIGRVVGQQLIGESKCQYIGSPPRMRFADQVLHQCFLGWNFPWEIYAFPDA